MAEFTIKAQQQNYHIKDLVAVDVLKPQYAAKTKVTYTFFNHFHPYVGDFVGRLNRGELEDLLSINTQKLKDDGFFARHYTADPQGENTLAVKPAKKEVDLSVEGPYSIYNWELFFHIPLAIADQLRVNQRFAEAQKWFHFIFDPTTDEKPIPGNPTGRYWKFRQFREDADPDLITDLLEDLSDGVDSPQIEALKKSIKQWKKQPFSPHEVAKFRPLAYQFNVVMKYLDNLIEWGDSLFRQFTIETINEATQIYVLAANILGDRPQEIPNLKKRPIRNYKQLKSKLDEFGNALVEMENEFPLNTNVSGLGGDIVKESGVNSVFGMSRQLYFCIPENKKLLGYWDTVADRLFKIRNCMDIEGNVRQLPLFQPPIDPGMLVKAVAGGISLSSIIGGLNLPVSNVRYTVLIQKALQICQEVRNMGNSLLSAIEKGDAEKLALLRQEHELNILTLSQDIKYLQWKETESATEALIKTRETAYQKYRHYQTILGKSEGDFSDLEEIALDRTQITEENFDDIYEALVGSFGQDLALEDYREDKHGLIGVVVDVASSITGAIADLTDAEDLSEHFAFNTGEKLDLNVFGPLSTQLKIAGWVTKTLVAPLLGLIPQFDVHGTPLGVGGAAEFGGEQLSKGAEYLGEGMEALGVISTQQGAHALKIANYQRRVQEWIFQNNIAAKELRQVGHQIVTSMIREQVARKDYENHKVRIEQSQAIDTFLQEQKFTNEALYLWMQGKLSKVYYDCYKLAFDTAKQAEVTLKHELMRASLDERDFIKFNYWDTGRKGLLSGEALFLDLKRMEMAYYEQNKREFELTKHVSLRQLDPVALLKLKSEGSCEITLPEWLFDLDAPGHYMRRIKTVALSIPAVAGPYTSINCTLSLHKSSIRKTAVLSDGEYARQEEDDRFTDYFGAIQSIVTSNAQNDSGLFEVNMRDERYLPFEGAGVVDSRWRLELPAEIRQFNYNTITDVILHIRYTARQGGALLAQGASTYIKDDLLPTANAMGLAQMFHLKRDFPDAWHQFTASEDANLFVTIRKEHFPYLSQAFDVEASNIQVWEQDQSSTSPLPNAAIITPGDPADMNDPINDDGAFTVELDRASLDPGKELYLVVLYALAE